MESNLFLLNKKRLKAMTNPGDNQIRRLKIHIWIMGGLLLGVIILVAILLHREQTFNYQQLLQLLSATKDTTNHTINNKDTVVEMHSNIIYNKRIEDSLQQRIERAFDSLENIQNKLKLIRSNSHISTSLVIMMSDSVDHFRRQVMILKQKIDSISKKTAQLLQKERENNSQLQKKIESYEKRLMELYAMNIEIQTLSDGYDQNSKIKNTTQAKRVKEISVLFKLNRDLQDDDEIILRLFRNKKVIMEQTETTIGRRKVRKGFIIKDNQPLSSGAYEVVILHNNSKFEIHNVEIGRKSFDLD